MPTPFLYQLQNASYQSLSQRSYRLAVVDMDDSALTASEVAGLESQGKQILTYLSVGEAEDYRDYWQDGNWGSNPPSFLLGENPNWDGNFRVKFWDPAWQQIMFDRVDAAIERGYGGMYLDIVDAYEIAQVKQAYPGTATQLRQEMVNFVLRLSQHAKAQDPDFLVVPQNAVGLLAASENNPGGASNTAYLNAIDGLGVEDLWYNGNSNSGWTNGDLQFIQHALRADKFVLATSYPTQDAKQADFVNKAIAAGLIPFVADRDLTGVIDSVNDTIEAKMAGLDINLPWEAPGGGDPGDVLSVLVAENGTTAIGSGTLPTAITGGVEAARFVVDGSGLKFAMAPDYESPQDAGGDNVYDVVVRMAGVDRTLAVRVTDVAGLSYTGNGQANVATGTPENDTMTGRGGNDRLSGLAGNDTLNGDGGTDTLEGGVGADILNGGSGNDRLIGDLGSDTLSGNGGADVFVFAAVAGQDRILGFERGRDDLDLGPISFAALDSNRNGVLDNPDLHVTVSGSSTIIDLALGNTAVDASTVTVVGVTGLTLSDVLL